MVIKPAGRAGQLHRPLLAALALILVSYNTWPPSLARITAATAGLLLTAAVLGDC